jgi:hypothetical protein
MTKILLKDTQTSSTGYDKVSVEGHTNHTTEHQQDKVSAEGHTEQQ